MKQDIYITMEVISLIPQRYSVYKQLTFSAKFLKKQVKEFNIFIKNVFTLKSGVSSKITNFQEDVFV